MRKYLALNDAREVIAHLIEGVHEIPSDAVLIDAERWYEVTQNIGYTWHFSDDRVLSKHPKIVPLEDPARFERERRDTELAAVIWLRERHRDQKEIGFGTALSDAQFEELLLYIQALRDWPQSPNFPDIEHRPLAPAWIANQTE